MSTSILFPEQIATLTAEQRLALIEALGDSLEQDDLPITPAQAENSIVAWRPTSRMLPTRSLR